jgi:hypothetical protein
MLVGLDHVILPVDPGDGADLPALRVLDRRAGRTEAREKAAPDRLARDSEAAIKAILREMVS